MPSTEVDVSSKKHKKSKKNKQQQEEAEAEEQPQQVEEDAEQHAEQEEKAHKKKKKNKRKQEDVEEEEAQAAEEEKEAAEEEEKPEADEAEEEEAAEKEEDELEVDESAVEKVTKQLQSVEQSYVDGYRSAAQKVAKKFKNDPVSALSAAIVALSGVNKQAKSKNGASGGSDVSILTQRPGFTTYSLTKADDEIRGKSFAYVIIKRILGEEEGDAAISHIKFTKDKMVNIPSDI